MQQQIYCSLPFLYIFRPSCGRIRDKAIFVYSKLQIFNFFINVFGNARSMKKKIAISKRKTTAHFIISIFCAKYYCDFHANVFFFLLCGQIKKIQFNVYKNTLPSNTNCNFMILLQSVHTAGLSLTFHGSAKTYEVNKKKTFL